MFERQGEAAQISFQWVVGDNRALEKNVIELIKPEFTYAITVASRLAAFGLTFAVASLLLPEAGKLTLIAIVFAASMSIWVSIGLEIFVYRVLERLRAEDPSRVGWNSVWLDSTGVTWTTETSEQYTSWLGVIDVIETDGSIWLKTEAASGFYIPPRVFSSAEEVTECRKLIADLRENPLPPAHLAGPDEELVRH